LCFPDGRRAWQALALAGALLAGCRQDMHDQAKVEALEGSDFFADGRGSRPLVAGTIPRGGLRLDAHYFTGRVGDAFADAFPAAVTRDSLARGRERYDIFCAPCHDRVGNGLGMIVRRGFRRPPSLHIDRLREAPPGYFVDVITRGFGAMSDYAAQVPPADRWAIAAYIRALQLSQNARVEDVPPEARAGLGGSG
jgi:mono/diheme cytochrome c family protein